MYTRCPHCQTYFKITTEQLKKAGGKVRCGQCAKVFNSLGNLLEELPVALSDRNKVTPQQTAAPRPPLVAPLPPARAAAMQPAKPAAPKPPAPKPAAPIIPPRPAPEPKPKPKPALKPAPKVAVKPAATDDELVFNADEPMASTSAGDGRDTLQLNDDDKVDNVPGGSYSSMRELVLYPGPRIETSPPIFGNPFWNTGVAVLLTIFVLQYGYFMRDDLARYPELRPWVQKLCDIAHCDIPMQQNVDLIKLTHRDITIHPRVKGALLINAVFVNNASFTQPFPLMQITLSDMNGRVIAKRRFQPTEYLDADVNIRRGMSSNNPVQIVLEIADPGKDAVNFEFNFFYQS